MKKILTKKISLLLTAALLLVSIGGTWGVTYFTTRPSEQPVVSETRTFAQLYDAAVRDAMTVELEELHPLVSLEKKAPYATYDAQGRILLLTFHKYPDSYPNGADVSLSWGEVWTFTGGELADWVDENGEDVADWPLRFRQLIGLSPDNEATHFTAMWVKPEDIVRPAYLQETGEVQMTVALAKDTDEEFKVWFDGNVIRSYFDSAYPWTRLGYTYDWAAGGREYGLSEFLVKKGSAVTVAYTSTTEEFIEQLRDGSWLPKEAVDSKFI